MRSDRQPFKYMLSLIEKLKTPHQTELAQVFWDLITEAFSLHDSPTGKNLIVRTSQKTDCFSARSLDELLAKAFEDFPKSS
ncbi:hypothetical protein NIES3806_39460 [Microcystis aeruginosa NIES-3806]|nr:hypothetical protein NIES3806_39460 [Microcystis aeruginosa NIES-3806]